MVREVGQGPLADAAGDDEFDTQLAQPTRKGSGRVFRGRQHLGVQHGVLSGVHLDQGEFTAATEVPVQTSVLMGYRNFHRGW
jgi:hypothetical protein